MTVLTFLLGAACGALLAGLLLRQYLDATLEEQRERLTRGPAQRALEDAIKLRTRYFTAIQRANGLSQAPYREDLMKMLRESRVQTLDHLVRAAQEELLLPGDVASVQGEVDQLLRRDSECDTN